MTWRKARVVFDCDMSRAIIEDTETTLEYVCWKTANCMGRAPSELWTYEKCEREHFCLASSLVSLSFSPRVRAQAPHRMNNWNNAERKRGAVSWRSHNIDRKITIGLKPESLIRDSGEAKDRIRSTDQRRWSTLRRSILVPRVFHDPRLLIVSREIRCTLVNKAIKTQSMST